MTYSKQYGEEERRRRWPAAAATSMDSEQAGPIRVAARRCSSLAYSASSTPRSSRLARLAARPSAVAGYSVRSSYADAC